VKHGKTSVKVDQCYYQYIVTAYDVQLAVFRIIIIAVFRTARRCLAKRNLLVDGGRTEESRLFCESVSLRWCAGIQLK
jgi:hypothetical protein